MRREFEQFFSSKISQIGITTRGKKEILTWHTSGDIPCCQVQTVNLNITIPKKNQRETNAVLRRNAAHQVQEKNYEENG